jgi:hypothetical protein
MPLLCPNKATMPHLCQEEMKLHKIRMTCDREISQQGFGIWLHQRRSLDPNAFGDASESFYKNDTHIR